MLTSTDHLRHFGLWTAVCSISAVPSFALAYEEYDVTAMIVGILCFIGLLTTITGTRAFARFRRRAFVRPTLYAGYGLRLGMSIMMPLGVMIDLFPGVVSIGLVEALDIRGESFVGTLLITLVQGTLLNIILTVAMLIIYGLQRAFRTPPVIDPLICEASEYSLRGLSKPRCPECGQAFDGALLNPMAPAPLA